MKQGLSGSLLTAMAAQCKTIGELFTFALPPCLGGTVNWSALAIPITYNSTTWVVGPVFGKAKNHAERGLSIDVQDLIIYPGTITVGGMTLQAAATQGLLDQVLVTIQRVYLDNSNNVIGVVPIFSGYVGQPKPGTDNLTLILKSGLGLLASLGVPFRSIMGRCSYGFADARCGLTAATYTTATTLSAAAGVGATTITVASVTANVVVGSVVTFTSGANQGLVRMVAAIAGSVLTLDYPLAFAANSGDGVSILRGCDKTLGAGGCAGFSNQARYGGYPFSINPEAGN
jgi:hypothetical protein